MNMVAKEGVPVPCPDPFHARGVLAPDPRLKGGEAVKVVINECHGGFGLSHTATEVYLARKGKRAYWFNTARDDKGLLDWNLPPVRVHDPSASDMFLLTYTTPDAQEDSMFSDHDIPRDDPDLVAVVEQMGDEANDTFAKLKVVEIPDGIEWHVSEYDGLEWIDEKHRSWS